MMHYSLITSGVTPYNIAAETVRIIAGHLPGAGTSELVRSLAVKISAIGVGTDFSWGALTSLIWEMGTYIVSFFPGLKVANIVADLISNASFL